MITMAQTQNAAPSGERIEAATDLTTEIQGTDQPARLGSSEGTRYNAWTGEYVTEPECVEMTHPCDFCGGATGQQIGDSVSCCDCNTFAYKVLGVPDADA